MPASSRVHYNNNNDNDEDPHNDPTSTDEEEEEIEEVNANTVSPRRREQRRRILFQVLFRHIMNSRTTGTSNEAGGEDSSSSDPSSSVLLSPEVLKQPVRILLTDEDALACGAQCRFCFESTTTTTDDNNNTTTSIRTKERNRLIAPCNCSGGSEWVHLLCLRMWQRQASFSLQFSSSNRQNAAAFCNVCTSPYLVPPLPRPRLRSDLFDKGAMLVARNTGGTFEQSVVLLLNDLEQQQQPGGRTGIIINKPLPREVTCEIAVDDIVCNRYTVEWRRGGPVCGGRLGVVRYMIAHTLDLGQREDEELLDDEEYSLPVFTADGDGTPPLQMLYESNDQDVPQVYDQEDLPGVLRRLNRRLATRASSSSSASFSEGKVIIFAGFCKWARNQLEGEVHRNAWDICHGRQQDVLWRNNNQSNSINGLWESLTTTQGRRLLSAEQLLTDSNDSNNDQ